MRWRAALLAVTAALVGACSSGEEAGPTATVVGTAAPTTVATDPYAVPEVIDEAYVNRVLAGLDEAVGDVTRIVVQSRTIPPEVGDRLKALYVGEFRQLRLDAYQLDMQKGFSDYEPNPGNARTTVDELITVHPICIFARVTRDASAIAKGPEPAQSTLWVALKPLDPNTDPRHFNPTGWVFVYDGFQEGRAQPSDPCAGS